MKECEICKIIAHPITLDNMIVYENSWFIVKAAKGMPDVGHLLVIPKKHINGMAELEEGKLRELYVFCNKVADRLRYYTSKEVILFEHWSLENGRHPQSIVHAHIHIIPITLTEESFNRMIDGCKLNKIESVKEMENVKHKDYWFFQDNDNNMYLSHDVANVPRSIIFHVVADQAGLPKDYEWRDEKNNDKEKLLKTFLLTDKIFNEELFK